MTFFGLCQPHQVSLSISEMRLAQASSLIRIWVITVCRVLVVLRGAQREVQHVARSSEQTSLSEVSQLDDAPRFYVQHDAQEPWPQLVSIQYAPHVQYEQRAQFSSLISLTPLVYVPLELNFQPQSVDDHT
jgi:hypothetical protein